MTAKIKRNKLNHQLIINIFFILFSLSFILPILLILAVSLSNEKDLVEYGYRLIPKRIDFTAYKYVFNNPRQIINSYQVTIFFTFLGTLLSVFIMSLCAYPLSRKGYKYKNQVTFFIFFTMLFGGGLVPTYILITQYLNLGNTIWVYIVPSLANAFHIIILRTFFQALPDSLIESAQIDGAKELRIFLQIILPLSKPVLATIAVFGILQRWNDWFTAMMYIRNPKLFSLQYLLQKVLMEVGFLQNNFNRLPPGVDIEKVSKIPTESMRMAMCIIVAGPVLFVFPFFQKYFTKGLTVGAVKG